MALPREILQSVEIEAVKSARVSGDYILSRVKAFIKLYFFENCKYANLTVIYKTAILERKKTTKKLN
jgi:hypothetical protein